MPHQYVRHNLKLILGQMDDLTGIGFTDTIHSVTVDVSGVLIKDDEATLRRMMAQQ